MTLQHFVDIASKYTTQMADEMLKACVKRALKTGERLNPRRRVHADKSKGARSDDDEKNDWERMVRCNSDIPALFRKIV